MDIDELDLPDALRPYQWEGVSFLAKSEGALLADEMGMGKTVQAAVALRIQLAMENVDRALIVTPTSLSLNWMRELATWAPGLTVRLVEGTAADRRATYALPIPVLITTYEQLRIDRPQMPADLWFDIVVLDEAQRIKNANSTSALACRLLRRTSSWALTGTPVENSLEDLASIFAFVRPGLIQAGMPRRLIHDRIKPYFLRRRKSDVLAELPPIIVQDMYLELGSFQRRAYDELWDNRAQLVCTEGLPASDVHMLAVITKLKLLCNFDPSSEESSKLDALRLVLEGLSEGDDKVILFSQFVTTLRWIAERIGQIPCSMLHGGMSMAERDAAVAEFESEAGPRVFLISLRAGGVGLNLNSASTVIMFDRWWNPALEEQAIQRAHRYGRKRPLHVMRFVVQETVEQRIESILQSKQALFSEYVDGAKNSATAAFTRDELRQILGLRKSESG